MEKFRRVLKLIRGICEVGFAVVAIALMISLEIDSIYYLFCIALLGLGIYEIYGYFKTRGSNDKTNT